MARRFNLKMVALCALLTILLVIPALAQGKAEPGEKFKERRIQMIKQLKLAPDKEKAVLAVGDKYDTQRQELITALKKAHADLEAALAAPSPDEAKVKELITAFTAAQDKLFATLKSQRDEEMALMTPIEQGKYFLALGKWRHEMISQGKEKAGKGKK